MNVEHVGPYLKGKTRKQLKARKDRAEAKVTKNVRAQCVARDGSWCRVQPYRYNADVMIADRFSFDEQLWRECQGDQAWAHMAERRRSQTRGEAPEKRHTTAGSLMLCTFHHDQYDGRRKPRLLITSLTKQGADGPLKFRRAKA